MIEIENIRQGGNEPKIQNENETKKRKSNYIKSEIHTSKGHIFENAEFGEDLLKELWNINGDAIYC